MEASPLWRCSDSASSRPLKHTHTRSQHVRTHTDQVCLGTPGGQHREHTHARPERSRGGEKESGGTEGKETSLDTFHTFHLLLIVGGVALRRPLLSAKKKKKKGHPSYTSRERREGSRGKGAARTVGSHLDSIGRIVHHRALRLLGGKQRI